MAHRRKTKIVCTLGPASSSEDRVRDLIEAGMNVARLNLSHGDHESHARTIRTLREVSGELQCEIGILLDLRGPKIRVGTLPEAERELEAGTTILLVAGESTDTGSLPIDYPYLVDDVTIGDHILLADGSIELRVDNKRSDCLECRVLVGGTVQSHKGVNLPASPLRVSAFTDKDRADLDFGLKHDVDFVALSFVRHEDDLQPIIDVLHRRKHRPLLIAKIEKPQAVERLEKILERVDGVMVARGDLGVETPLAEVPMLQKRLIQTARRAGKPVITATQMLRSMVDSPRPTRAEAADVANAILDGTDAVMLSEETAVGRFPTKSVEILDAIARATEPDIEERVFLQEPTSGILPETAAAISRAAVLVSRDLRTAAILAFTSSGATARLVSRLRPLRPVIGLTYSVSTQRQLALSWGVHPVLVNPCKNETELGATAGDWALGSRIANKGDRVVLTAGIPPGVPGKTNLLKVLHLET